MMARDPVQDARDRLARLNATLERQQTDLANTLAGRAARLNRQLADANDEARVRDARAARRFQNAQLAAAEGYRARLGRVNAEANLNIQENAARLDARAVLEAERRRDAALDVERTRFALETRARERGLAESVAQNREEAELRERAYARRLEELTDSGRRETAALATRYNTQAAQLVSALQGELAARRNAYTQQSAALQASIAAQQTALNVGYSAALTAARLFVDGLAGLFNRPPAPTGSTRSLGAGRVSVNAPITVNAAGDPQAVARAVQRELRSVLEGL
jgi:hypothetical protein